jgi:hypothetical protein
MGKKLGSESTFLPRKKHIDVFLDPFLAHGCAHPYMIHLGQTNRVLIHQPEFHFGQTNRVMDSINQSLPAQPSAPGGTEVETSIKNLYLRGTYVPDCGTLSCEH